jgi:hypothetical protein
MLLSPDARSTNQDSDWPNRKLLSCSPVVVLVIRHLVLDSKPTMNIARNELTAVYTPRPGHPLELHSSEPISFPQPIHAHALLIDTSAVYGNSNPTAPRS